jgi:para-nitrobenzyl esterase
VLIPAEDTRGRAEKCALAFLSVGRLAPIPLLIGACHDDYQPYPHILPPDTVPQDEKALIQHFDRLDLDGASLAQASREWLAPVEPEALFVAAMSDLTFCQPAIHFAERHAAHHPVYAYDFRWASPVQDGAMGAGHTVDIPFAMHTLWTPHTPYHLGDHPPVSLADQMHDTWSTFTRTGKPAATGLPDWPQYDSTQRLTMAFNKTSSIQRDPQAERRLYWAEQFLMLGAGNTTHEQVMRGLDILGEKVIPKFKYSELTSCRPKAKY